MAFKENQQGGPVAGTEGVSSHTVVCVAPKIDERINTAAIRGFNEATAQFPHYREFGMPLVTKPIQLADCGYFTSSLEAHYLAEGLQGFSLSSRIYNVLDVSNTEGSKKAMETLIRGLKKTYKESTILKYTTGEKWGIDVTVNGRNFIVEKDFAGNVRVLGKRKNQSLPYEGQLDERTPAELPGVLADYAEVLTSVFGILQANGYPVNHQEITLGLNLDENPGPKQPRFAAGPQWV